MSKSFKEAFKHTRNDSKSIWSILWGITNFIWLCYCTFQIKGSEETANLITEKIFIGVFPFIIGLIGLFLYHYVRSDFYLEQSKPTLGKSLIPGRLLRMVENWKPQPIEGLANLNLEYQAYQQLKSYRTSYEFDSIHQKIDEFLFPFEINGNVVFPSIKTKFQSSEEANAAFPRLKELAKEISKSIT